MLRLPSLCPFLLDTKKLALTYCAPVCLQVEAEQRLLPLQLQGEWKVFSIAWDS